jgi:predicted PurR-regulated permease PerM
MDESVSSDSPREWMIAPVTIRGATVTIFVGAGVLYATREGVSFLAPMLVSILLAYALEPFVALSTRAHLPRPLAIVTVYSLLIAGLVLGTRLVQSQVTGFLDTLPVTVQVLQQSVERAHAQTAPSRSSGPLARLQKAASELNATIGASAHRSVQGVRRVVTMNPRFSLGATLAGASRAIGTVSAQLIAVAILTPLLLFGGEGLKRKVIALAGPRAQKKVTYDVIKAIDRQIERYLVARVLISGLVAGATWLGLWILGVREPLVLGLVAGVLNVVPFIGPAIAVALVAVVAFVQFQTIEMTAAAVAVAGAVAAIEGNLISPWLTSRAGELNTVAVFVSILFWGWMWDVWGLVLAVPIMVTIKAAADHVEPLQPIGELLGE